MRKSIVSFFRMSILGGTIDAIYRDLRSLVFNFRSALRHMIGHFEISYFSFRSISKIHFGCGFDYKDGFLNIDIGRSADIFLDARNRMPFKTNSIEFIYSSHFIEHLTNIELLKHLNECFRILKIGACYRIGLPDFNRAISEYLNKDLDAESRRAQAFPLKKKYLKHRDYVHADFLDRALHEYGSHKVFIDIEKLQNMLIDAGFSKEHLRISQHDPQLDSEARREFTLYLEAYKN